MELQLYMWSGTRRIIIDRHDFYVLQVKGRVLAQFRDIEGEADRYAKKEYDRIGRSNATDDGDMGAAAEVANDHAIEFYSHVVEMRQQMLLGALAGLYHQWDKDLRDFVERELLHYMKSDVASKIAWDPNVGNVFDVLQHFGWDCRAMAFFPRISACRLIVNVYKHGKGRSLDELASNYPEYLRGPFDLEKPKSAAEHKWLISEPQYDRLAISEPQFDEFASALREFWEAFPERLYLQADAS